MRVASLTTSILLVAVPAAGLPVAAGAGDPDPREPRAEERRERVPQRVIRGQSASPAERLEDGRSMRTGPRWRSVTPPGGEAHGESGQRPAIERKSRYSGPGVRMAPVLLRLLEAGTDEKSLAAASAAGVLEAGDVVPVEIVAGPQAAAGLQEQLAAAGIKRVADLGRRIWADVPVDRLSALKELDGALLIGLQQRGARSAGAGRDAREASPKLGELTAEGVEISGATQWQEFDADARGLGRSEPVSVAILERGFLGYADLLSDQTVGELPPDGRVFEKDAAPSWDIEGCTDTPPIECWGPTGTALAEVVADMAPAAELHLIAVDDLVPDSYAQAVDYILDNDIDVAVHGLVWSPGLPGDGWGTGAYNAEIRRAIDGGVLWINDVGSIDDLMGQYLAAAQLPNYQDQPIPPEAAGHWMGRFVDEVDQYWRGTFETDGYMDVWFEGETATTGNQTWLNEFCLGPGDEIYFELVWDDWVDQVGDDGFPESSRDYGMDVWILEADDQRTRVDSSGGADAPAFNIQDGENGDAPWDSLSVVQPDGTDPQCYQLSIFADFLQPGASADNRFHLYWVADNVDTPGQLSADFEPPAGVSAGTRMIPADEPGVAGVGLTNLLDQPDPSTNLGIPEEGTLRLCAPAIALTESLFPFTGPTPSFSAAYTAGAVTLLMDKVGFLSAEQAMAVLEARATGMGGRASEEECAAGRLCTLTGGGCPLEQQQPSK